MPGPTDKTQNTDFSIVKSPKRKAAHSFSGLAYKKQKMHQDEKIRRDEEISAAAAHAVITRLKELRIQIAKELEMLDALYEKLCDCVERAGFQPETSESSELTRAELEALALETDLPPELKSILDQYLKVQHQVELLDQQIQDTENQLKIQHRQQQQVETQLAEIETKQEQLKQETTNTIHQELSNRIGDHAPSKTDIDDMFATNADEQDLQDMSSETRQALEETLQEQLQARPNYIPTLKPTPSAKKAAKEEGDEVEQEENQQENQLMLLRNVPRAVGLAVRLEKFMAMRMVYDPHTHRSMMQMVVGHAMSYEFQMGDLNIQFAAVKQQALQIQQNQYALHQRVEGFESQRMSLVRESNCLEHDLEKYSSGAPTLTTRSL